MQKLTPKLSVFFVTTRLDTPFNTAKGTEEECNNNINVTLCC